MLSELMAMMSGTGQPNADMINKIASNEENDGVLSPEVQSSVNEMNRAVNGEDSPYISTINEMDDLNRAEAWKQLQQSERERLAIDIDSVISGDWTATDIDRSAASHALDGILVEDDRVKSALALSYAKNQQALAALNNPSNVDTNSSTLINFRNNWAIFQDKLMKLRSEASGWDVTKQVLSGFVPGVEEVASRNAYERYTGLEGTMFKPVEMQRKLKAHVSHDLMYMPNLQFDAQLEEFIKRSKEDGVNTSRLASQFETMFDPSYNAEIAGALADVAAGAGVVVKAGAGALKGTGLVGKTVSTIRGGVHEAVSQINPLEIVPYVGSKTTKLVNGVMDASVNFAADTTTKVGKKLIFGDVEGAANDIVKMVGDPTEARAPEYLSNGVSSMSHVSESEVTNVSYNPKVLSKKNEELRTQRAIEELGTTSLEEVKQSLWDKYTEWVSDTLKAEDTYQNAYGIADVVRVADLSRDLRLTEKGYLAISVRLNKAFKSLENAEAAAKSLTGNAGGIKVKARASAYEEAGDAYTTAEFVKADIVEPKEPKVKDEEIVEGAIDENPVKISKVGERYYVDVDIEADKGWGTLWAEQDIFKGKRKEWRGFGSGFATRTSTPLHIQMLDEGRFMDVSHLTSTFEGLVKGEKSLSVRDRALFNALKQKSLDTNAWYTPEHLLARDVPEKVVKQYSDYKIFSDFERYVTNKADRQRMIEQGVRDLYVGEERLGYGRVVPKNREESLTAIMEGKRKIIIGTGDEVEAIDANSKLRSEWEGLLSNNVLVERIYGPDEFTAAKSVYYLVPSSSLVSRDLPQFVSNYVAGGRRYFDKNNAFVKQIQVKPNAAGVNVITGVKTFFADLDKEGMRRKTEVLEAIRRTTAKGVSDAEITRVISESDQLINAPFKDAEGFRQWAKEVGMDITNEENALEVVMDGDPISSYQRLKEMDGFEDLIGPEEMYNIVHRSHFQALTNEAKMQKKRRTGRILYDYNWDVAQTVDFEKEIRYMVNDMVYNGTMKDFSDFYADSFVEQYKTHLRDFGAANMTNRKLLEEGTVKSSTEPSVRAAIEAAQKNYAMIKGVPTRLDQKIGETAQIITNWIGVKMCDELKFLSDSAKHNVRVNFEKLSHVRPLSFGRTFASHYFLGFFNVSQLYKQAAANVNVLALEPVAGMKAMKNVLPLTAAMLKCDGDYLKAIEEISKKFGDNSKIAVEFQNLVKLGAFQHGIAGGFLEQGQTVRGKLSKLSMMPFNWSEMNNRVYSMLTAMHAKGFGDKVIESAEDLLAIKTYGQRLFMNMDATGLSRAQSGEVGKTLLQMLGFKMRWIEALCFDGELTKAQKGRLALVMAALTGTEGFLGMKASTWAFNLFRNDSDKNEPSKEQMSQFKAVVQKGLINYAAQNMGLNYDLAAPLSVEMADDIYNLFAEPKSLMTLSLPSVSVAKSGIDLVSRIWSLQNKDFVTTPNADDFSNVVRLAAEQGEFPSSINKTLLGYFLYKHGDQFNGKGQLKRDDGTKLDAVLTTLGFNSMTDKEVYKAMIQYSDKAELYKELKATLMPQYVRLCQLQSPRLWELFKFQLKAAELSPMEKGRLWREINEEAVKNQVVPLYKQMWYRQILKGGEYGNNFLIKENR